MIGSDNDELPRREIEARMSKGLKQALATPAKGKAAQKRPAAQPGRQSA